ncbi:pyrimidine 5'-nucleotidase [uncultured Algimonas sp.]|uniref:pyrimidine 5'-nucleotidase n=1 Tax=uncultured Algimonas sp. TaxID=1547920 RepID=UPI002630AAFD|nr:pyrimidine 5'-nucleotidase [uncultured Algimonas sp.]
MTQTDAVRARPGGGEPIIDLSGIRTWIFDLDNTLYRANVSFFADIGEKMTAYISRYLALQPDQARQLQEEYFHDYGATLSGMMDIHGMDPAEFLDYVHDVDLSVLAPNPPLRHAIAALPGRRLIFTNGSRGHIRNVAGHLDLLDLFEGGFAIEDAHYIPKPKRPAYETFLDVFDVDPATAIFFEDTPRNLEVPKQMGMTTVLVGEEADWGRGVSVNRTSGTARQADWVDAVTDDLAGWLRAHCPRTDL